MRGLLAVLLAVASCAPPPPVASSADPPQPASQASSAVTPGRAPTSNPVLAAKPPLTPCQEVGRAQRSVLFSFIDEARRFTEDFNARELVEPWCASDDKGMWALEIEDVVVEPGKIRLIPMPYPQQASFSGKLRVARIDASGKHVAAQAWKRPPGKFTTVPDLNGDGIPELQVVEGWRGASTLWTLRGGAVVRYPTTERFLALKIEDVDGDGRLDLLYTEPFLNDVWDEQGVDNIELLAHGLPDGRFSLGDAAAVAHAKKGCDDVPRELPAADEFPLTSRIVRCARLRGVPSKDVLRQIDRMCGKKGCWQPSGLQAWAKAEPFFSIPEK